MCGPRRAGVGGVMEFSIRVLMEFSIIRVLWNVPFMSWNFPFDLTFRGHYLPAVALSRALLSLPVARWGHASTIRPRF